MCRGGAAPAETADFSGLMNVRATAGQRAYIQFMNFIAEHVGLAAREPSVLKDWYVNMLRANLVYDNGQTPPAYLLTLPGGLMLEIYQSDSFIKETGHNLLAGWRHLALQVDSIESARAELEAKGVEFPNPVKPAGGGGLVLFFRDIEGNLLHFVERPEHSTLRRFQADPEK